MVKLSDYVIRFLVGKGITDIFLVSGGGCIHLVDSVGNNREIKYICNLHEQACAMGMEGYARMRNDAGACLVTTGPGATNAITGVIGAWLDSVPSIVISGQVKTTTMRTAPGCSPSLRQLGDQEINIIDIVKPITKYSVTVMDPGDIRYHLEKAFFLAKNGRPGPVWIDIPFDVQAAIVDEKKLRAFDPHGIGNEIDLVAIEKQADETIRLLKKAKRPVLLAGKGIRISNGMGEFEKLVKLLKIPVVTSFSGFDVIEEENEYYYGRQGTVGQRRGNFIVQNSDLLLAIGTRLNIRMVSYDWENFAREAKKIVVDIDPAELGKPTVKPDIPVLSDAKIFMQMLLDRLADGGLEEKNEWIAYADRIYRQYRVPTKEQYEEKGYANAYVFFNEFSRMLEGNGPVVLANGMCCVGPYQAMEVKKGQRFIVNSGCASMGYGLPAAIGVCAAIGRKPVFCLEGDGSLQMNMQELQTVKHYGLPIKIFVINNAGYLSIRETQKGMFNSRFVASSESSGVSSPDLEKISFAYGIDYLRISSNDEIKQKVGKVMAHEGPIICEVMTDPEKGFMVKVTSHLNEKGLLVSKPLEDMFPLLPRDEFKKNMIVKTVNE